MLKARQIALVLVVVSLSVPAFGSAVDDLGDSGWKVSGPDFMDLNVITDAVHWADDPDDSYVLIEIHKNHWVSPDADGNFSPITLSFIQTAEDAAPVPNIRIRDEDIFNATGADWTGYNWILSNFQHSSFNTDIPVYTGYPPDAPEGVWDVHPFNQHAWDIGETTEKLSVFDGLVEDGDIFRPGIYSSGYLEINVDVENTFENYRFALKQLPIPEPATLSLLALGAGALVCRRRRGRD